MQQQTAEMVDFTEIGLAATVLAGTGQAEAGLAGAGQTGGEAGSARRRVEAVVETLANLRGGGESLAEVAHDARNMVTALGLYCDLLEEPGVLTAPFVHYAGELRLVAAASRRLVEKLLLLDLRLAPLEGSSGLDGLTRSAGFESAGGERPEYGRYWDRMPAQPIANLAAELLANRNLLSALAGPMIAVTVDVEGGALPVRLSGEDAGGRTHSVGVARTSREERRCRGSDAHGGGQRAGHPSQGARGDLRVRLHHPLRRSRRARRLAGLASRPGPVDYPLHRRGCRRPRSCRQPRSRRSPL